MSIPHEVKNPRAYFAQCVVLLCLAASAAVLVGFRYHAFEVPLERDEGNYAYIAARLLAGDQLYVDVWDHQPFGVFVLFAAVISVFGDSPEVFRWLAVVFSLASMLLIFLFLRRFSGRLAAVLGAAMFALLSSDPGTAGEGCNREIYMNTLILLAWTLAWRAFDRSQSSNNYSHTVCLFVAGVALALGSAMKTVIAVHWLVLAGRCIYAATAAPPREPTTNKSRLRIAMNSVLLLGAGPALLWGGAFAYFVATGRLREFWDAVFGFNVGYAGQAETFLARWPEFFHPSRSPHVFDSALPLWVWTIAAAAWLAVPTFRLGVAIAPRSVDRSHGKVSYGHLSILCLLLANYAAICLPGQFWPHYYYLMLPAAVIAVSAVLGQLAYALTKWLQAKRLSRPTAGRARSVPYLLALIVLGVLFVGQYDHYLSLPPEKITEHRYRGVDFWARAHAERVHEVTKPDDDIFVYGNDATIYYYSHRRGASRYTMITALHSNFPGYEGHRRNMLGDLERRRPRLILVLLGAESFPEWEGFVERHYDAIGWDFRDTPPYDPVLMVLGNRDRPVRQIDWD